MPDLTTRTEAPTPVVVEPGTIVPGRARGAAPLRREGPAKLTGAAKYADDLVFPGAWFGATIRSTDAHARFVALDLDPAFDWSSVIVVTAADIPGDNVVSSIKADQPILVPIGGEIQHHAEPLALHRRARPGDAPGCPARNDRPDGTARAGVRPRGLGALSSPPTRWPSATPTPRSPPPTSILEGEYRVGHQEQLYIENNAMIAVPSGRRRGDRPRLAPVPLLRPHGVEARPRDGRPSGARRPGRDRRRVRWQGGVPVDHRAPCLAPRREGPAARADDLRPSRGHRGDDQAPPGDRPPPDRRDPRRPAARPGHRGRDGRRRVLHADPGRPVARRHPRRRAVPLPERPHPCPRDADEHAAERRVPRASGRRRSSSPRRRTSTGSPRRSGAQPARDPAAQRLPAGDTTPTGQVLRTSVAGEEVLERAAEAGEFERLRARSGAAREGRPGPGTVPGSPLRTGRDRMATGVGLALAWHGAGFTGSGEVKLASVASLELTADGRDRASWPPRPRWARGPRRSSRSSSPTPSTSRSRPSTSRPRTRRTFPIPARPSPRARRWSSADC